MNKGKLLTFAVTTALITCAPAAVNIDWIEVSNLSNAADTADGDSATAGVQRYGAVSHWYRIGKYEVTNSQYAAFLNAKAKSDPYSLYISNMASEGITRSGSSGSYTYSVDPVKVNRPVVFVSWFDVARFSNWLANGQGNGSTEIGSYTLNGATTGIINKNVGATIYIPTEDEWYKAAYYNGATSSYSLYPNGQNSITTADANYNTLGGTKNVGSYSEDPSSYGTFDQGGNVWEWNDSLSYDTERGLRGGQWNLNSSDLLISSTRRSRTPDTTNFNIGFRLATTIPEPSSILLTMLASGMVLIRRKR